MHRSRIGIVLIDHPESDWEEALGFWAGVQGVEPLRRARTSTGRSAGSARSALESQRTGDGHPARVHLDIETDDVAAEVARVVGLGADGPRGARRLHVLRDPGGLVFCVVPVQTGELFEREARTWP